VASIVVRLLSVAVLGLLAVATPARAQSAIWWDSTPRLLPPTDGLVPASGAEAPAATSLPLGRWLDAESSLGLDVAPFRPDLGLAPLGGGIVAGPGTPYRLIDTTLHGTAIALDLKLTWPSRVEPSAPGLLQPYVSFGPAVFVGERHPVPNPLATPSDVTMRVGLKAGAGLTWQVDRRAAFFGEYRVTRGMEDSLLSIGGRNGPGAGVSGYDLLYGLRFKF
jgi:hypothetical protein